MRLTILDFDPHLLPKKRSMEITCESCGTTQNTIVYSVINVTLDPSLKERLLRGKINVFQCRKCRKKVFLMNPFLYYDMIQPTLVLYCPMILIESELHLGSFQEDGRWAPDLIKKCPRKLRKLFKQLHVVLDIGELVRYVTFRDILFERRMRSR